MARCKSSFLTSRNSGSTLGANVLVFNNRQRLRRLSVPAIRELINSVLNRLGRTGEIGFHFVSPTEMARINWAFLRHEGSTDIITFDHGSQAKHLHGECFICVADAVRQAAEWDSTWTEELGRYVVHGLLHLCGYEDLNPAKRRLMKRRENVLTLTLVRPRRNELGR